MEVAADIYQSVVRPASPWFLWLLFIFLMLKLPEDRLEELIKLFFQEIKSLIKMLFELKPSGRGLNAAGLFGLLVYVFMQGHNFPDVILPSAPQPQAQNDLYQSGIEVIIAAIFVTALILCLKNTKAEK